MTVENLLNIRHNRRDSPCLRGDERLRRNMTIAIGILCSDGVVVGADREVTLDTLKVQDKKAHLLKRNNVSLGLVGSGSLDLISKAAQELDRRLTDEMSQDALKAAVENLAQEFHERYVLGNPNADHVLDLLIG